MSVAPTTSIPQNEFERLELARELFQRFHAQCFWHSPRDLGIVPEPRLTA